MTQLEFDQKYPQHAKLKLVQQESQQLGNFLEWLFEVKEYELGTMGRRGLETVYVKIPDILAEYFEIDQKALSKEKDMMYDDMTKARSGQ